MKPTLKVGDYAELTKPLCIGDKGKIVLITEITTPFIVKARHIVDGFECRYSNTRLEKIRTPVTEWAIIPDLTDLEQYRLSLEVYADLLMIIVMDIENKSMPIDYNSYKTLTEILEA